MAPWILWFFKATLQRQELPFGSQETVPLVCHEVPYQRDLLQSFTLLFLFLAWCKLEQSSTRCCGRRRFGAHRRRWRQKCRAHVYSGTLCCSHHRCRCRGKRARMHNALETKVRSVMVQRTRAKPRSFCDSCGRRGIRRHGSCRLRAHAAQHEGAGHDAWETLCAAREQCPVDDRVVQRRV